jgi:hypothetical protein
LKILERMNLWMYRLEMRSFCTAESKEMKMYNDLGISSLLAPSTNFLTFITIYLGVHPLEFGLLFRLKRVFTICS